MSCRSCGSKNIMSFLNLGKHIPSNFYIKNKNNLSLKKKIPLKVYFCSECFLVQIKDYISGRKLFLKNYAYLSGVSLTWQKHCSEFANYCIKRFQIKKNNSILEIASNDGTLLSYFKKRNIKVLGIEPTFSTAQIAISNKIKTEIKFFGLKESIKIKKKYKKFKLIIANNVLAHVDDVNDFTAGLSNIADEETIISVEFQYLINLIQKNQFDTIYHEHFSYYSLISFENLIKKHDLKIFDVKKIKTHGGSLRVFLCKNSKNIKISSTIYSMKKYEKQIGVANKNFYLLFNNQIQILKKTFNDNIVKIKKNKKTIYGYGAAAKGNTFLNYFKLKSNVISLIMDKNKFKIDNYSPGGLIKIVHPDILKTIQPDYILILAWNIKDEIIKEIKENYKYKNKFILAIPNFKIIN